MDAKTQYQDQLESMFEGRPELVGEIMRVAPNQAAVAKMKPQTLVALTGITLDLAEALVNWAQAVSEVNVTVTVATAANSTTSHIADPIQAMLAADEETAANASIAAEMAPNIVTYLWDTAGVQATLFELVQREGTGFVTDPDLSDWLDTWMLKVPTPTGGDMYVGQHMITVLPYAARSEVNATITRFLADSKFDRILRSGAVYRRAVSKSAYAQKMGGAVQVSLPNDVDDPDTIRANVEAALAEMEAALAGGRVNSRHRKMAKEYSALLVPAMNNAEVIASFGVPVKPGQSALKAFLSNPRNPQKRIQTGMKLAKVLHKALSHFAAYDVSKFDEWFATLCEIGQEYCMAVADFQATSPQPVAVSEGSYIGFRQALTSILAMVDVKVQVGGTTVEVTAQASYSAPSIEVVLEGYRINGMEIKKLQDAIVDTWPSNEALGQVFLVQLGIRLDNLSGSSLTSKVFTWVSHTNNGLFTTIDNIMKLKGAAPAGSPMSRVVIVQK